MKRKLLTVLLAVVMVFGVFGLTACGGSNADEDYNYYGIKYELEDEVKIQAVTYQGVYKMFTTAGRYLLYVDSETSSNVKADFQAINKFANEWNVTVYHFNPDLTGGYAKTEKTANANILKATGEEGNIISTAQSTLLAISNTTIDKWSDSKLVGVIGAESTASAAGELTYKGKVAAFAAPDKAAEAAAAICQQKVGFKAQKPSFGAYTDEKADKPLIPEAYMTESINTMNLFGDARLHMYNDDNGTDALTAEKEDVYVTLANYTMFAHLMDNNDGYFPVFFGGTWCPNTQAIVKITDKLAKDYGIEKIYFFDPNLTDGAIADSVKATTTWTQEKYVLDEQAAQDALEAAQAAYVATFGAVDALFNCEAEADALAAAQAEKVAIAAKYAKDKQYAQDAIDDAKDATALAAANKALADIVTAETKALTDAQKVIDDAQAALTAAEAIVSDFQTDIMSISNVTFVPGVNDADAEYVLARLVAARKAELAEAKKGTDKDAIAAAQAAVDFAEKVAPAYKADAAAQDAMDKAMDAYDAAQEVLGFETTYTVAENSDYSIYGPNTRDSDKNSKWAYAYASFLDNYLPTYTSEWNVGVKLNIAGKDYTKMCVPNIMMFNGEEENKVAELVALAEAEYYYDNISVEGDPCNVAWTEAVKKVFDANPYATYAPIMVAEEAAADSSAPAASAPAASSSSSESAC